MKKVIRLTEQDLHRIIKESVYDTLASQGMTYNQIRNMLGMQDDDELNAACGAEDIESLEGDIWGDIADLAGGNPRKVTFSFRELARMLHNTYGFDYVGPDEQNETHEFKDENGLELTIAPVMWYPEQGTMRIMSLHLC